MKIAPAILTEDSKDFQDKISQVEKFTDFAQIDIMDGSFVPSKSIELDVLSSVDTSLNLEYHLMVDNPIDYLEVAKKTHIKRVIFHYEVDEKTHSRIIETIKRLDMQVGIAINPQTTINQVKHLFKEIDLFLLMAVNPGYYGSPFIPEVLDKARELSEKNSGFILALDGGVKIDNILDIKDAGVDVACVGSGIFKADNPAEGFRLLEEKAA